jgi:hypothetical protein
MSNRLKQVTFTLILLGGSIFVGVLIVEGILRVTGLQSEFFYQLDPDIGASYIPGKKGWHSFMNGERVQWIEINSYGFRDREWTVLKTPGTVRIALLGDSYIAGMEIPAEERLSELLERRLNLDCAEGLHYEVMNFGVTGYGTAEELATLRHRALHFNPDVVILFFYNGNDLYNNSLELDPEPNRLHYVLNPDGQLSPLPFTVNDNAIKRWLRHHSRTFLFVRDKIKSVQAMRKAMMAIGLMQEEHISGAVDAQAAAEMLQNSQYLRESPPALEKAWRITEALIGEIQRVVEDNSTQFGMAVIPTREEILATDAPEGIPADKWNRRRSIEETTGICQRLRIDCTQLIDTFRSVNVSVDECFLPEGHWSEKGHAVAAEGIYEWLEVSLCNQGTPGTLRR